jgi:protein-tyrosine-phosphatase
MKIVLFVCVHNSGRSQMAEAFFNRLAKGKAKAKSAGTHPAKHLDDNVIEIMWEAGIEISRQRPKLLTPKLLDWADRVITMGCGVEEVCPATFVEAEDWAIEDPEDKPVEKLREIRDEIKSRVTRLLDELR